MYFCKLSLSPHGWQRDGGTASANYCLLSLSFSMCLAPYSLSMSFFRDEAQRGEVTCPRSYSYQVSESGFGHRSVQHQDAPSGPFPRSFPRTLGLERDCDFLF